jgi:hypothetical protein
MRKVMEGQGRQDSEGGVIALALRCLALLSLLSFSALLTLLSLLCSAVSTLALQDIMTYIKARVAARAAALDSKAAASTAVTASEIAAAAPVAVASAAVAEAPAEAAAAAVDGAAAAPAPARGKVNLFFSEDEFNQGAPLTAFALARSDACQLMQSSREAGAAQPACSTGQRWGVHWPPPLCCPALIAAVLAASPGKVVVVMATVTWCKPCKRFQPSFEVRSPCRRATEQFNTGGRQGAMPPCTCAWCCAAAADIQSQAGCLLAAAAASCSKPPSTTLTPSS